MQVATTLIDGVLILSPKVFYDQRGYFVETFNQKVFQKCTNLEINFVQDNQSFSEKGTLRGLHFQKGQHAQAKLVRVVSGKVMDVIVDLRVDSPTFGKHIKIILDQDNHQQIFIPRGCAHGFLVLSETAIFSYKCDNYYNQQAESGIIYNDPDLNIDWQNQDMRSIISEKDLSLNTFKAYRQLC